MDFRTAYLTVYLADRFDVSAEESINRANERVKHSTEDAIASTVSGYITVTAENTIHLCDEFITQARNHSAVSCASHCHPFRYLSSLSSV